MTFHLSSSNSLGSCFRHSCADNGDFDVAIGVTFLRKKWACCYKRHAVPRALRRQPVQQEEPRVNQKSWLEIQKLSERTVPILREGILSPSTPY